MKPTSRCQAIWLAASSKSRWRCLWPKWKRRVTTLPRSSLRRLRPSDANPGVDQATLAGLIAFDRTTITGVVERLTQKGLADLTKARAGPAGARIENHGSRTAHLARHDADGRSSSAHHAAWPDRQGSGTCAAACKRPSRPAMNSAARRCGMRSCGDLEGRELHLRGCRRALKFNHRLQKVPPNRIFTIIPHSLVEE